jgi:two-component system sensor histidine kinase CiaH
MAGTTKRRLGLVTFVYWILLFYIIAALVWWFLSLMNQNQTVYELREHYLRTTIPDSTSPAFQPELEKIRSLRSRSTAKYIGEGGTFLLLIIIGAVFVYRAVRRQFQMQQQQQNFVMAITHELKTPLSVTRLNLETLQKYKLEESKKEKLLHMTLQETIRLDSLINNILISSQLDGHSYMVTKEELSFSDLTHDVAHQFATRYPDRKFIESVEPDIDMNGDPLLLKLLVSNLLENANKYSPRDKPIHLRLSRSATGIGLLVSDEGAGIPPQERKNIFRKFYRVGNEEVRRTKGTGLGLYLCKKIAEDHEGVISVTDNQPQGSNFIVSFSV